MSLLPSIDRRRFLQLGAATVTTRALTRNLWGSGPAPARTRAVVFDAFPLFDFRSVFGLAEQLYPGRGAELSSEWRTHQFEYTWLRNVTGRYVDFWQVTEDALRYAGRKAKVPLDHAAVAQLMGAYLELKPWPEVGEVLQRLRRSGLRLAILSNFTPGMQSANVARAGFGGLFECLLSTDQAGAFKPAPSAYQLGVDALKLAPSEIVFVAFGGWDAAGAKLFGYPTYWVNRLGLPPEELGVLPDGTGSDLSELPSFINSLNPGAGNG